MGVKDLWSVISPVAQRKTLYDLHGKTLAIDLSCWVCEGQCIGEKITQPRMYLRNLFFRTHALLLMNVTPVFVLDGDAPDLKLDAMHHRNIARFKANNRFIADAAPERRQNGTRSRFKGILKQCRLMLEMMGVKCLQSDGEAEALCGQLNREGMVDGVITQDSDVFLYGARVVYRNLILKDGRGVIECYDMLDIEGKLKLTREKLVAMSLLCGCDYDLAGVHGVGKQTACKYLINFTGDILDRLRSLRDDQDLLRYEKEKENCSRCCHVGKLRDHNKSGCSHCHTTKSCTENQSPMAFKNLSEEDKTIVLLELSLRKKALVEPNFPNEETIAEFLNTSQEVSSINIKWNRPNLPKLCVFCSNMMEWELDYSFEKCLPLLTRWQLVQSLPLNGMQLTPNKIIKKRVVKGVKSFDVAWRAIDISIAELVALLTDDCKALDDGCCLTTEPEVAVKDKMSDILDVFTQLMTKKESKVKRKPRAVLVEEQCSSLVDSLKNLSLTSNKKSNRKKKKGKENAKFPDVETLRSPPSDKICIIPSLVNNKLVPPSNSLGIDSSVCSSFLSSSLNDACPSHQVSSSVAVDSHNSLILNSLENEPQYIDLSSSSVIDSVAACASFNQSYVDDNNYSYMDVPVQNFSSPTRKCTSPKTSENDLQQFHYESNSIFPNFKDFNIKTTTDPIKMSQSVKLNESSGETINVFTDLNGSPCIAWNDSAPRVNFSVGFAEIETEERLNQSINDNLISTNKDLDIVQCIKENDTVKCRPNISMFNGDECHILLQKANGNLSISESLNDIPSCPPRLSMDDVDNVKCYSDVMFMERTHLQNAQIYSGTESHPSPTYFEDSIALDTFSSTFRDNSSVGFAMNESSIVLGDSSLDNSFFDESTVDYDVSKIVDDILSRKRFY